MNPSQDKFKICIVSDQLANGGAERCAALLSQFFEKNNFEVHHVVVVDNIEYPFSGKILNLGKLKNESNGLFNRLKRFWVLNNFFRKNKFDYIIDFRVKRFQIQEFIIAKFIFRSPLLVTVHSYMTDLYFPKNNYLANKIYSETYKIITVSKGIEQKIIQNYNYINLKTIYNPIDIEAIEYLSNLDTAIEEQFVIAAGRMQDDIKQFDKLIDCYSKSVLPTQNIKLIVLGEGIEKDKLIKQVKGLHLEDKILFKGKVENPFVYFKKALYTVLSSRYEGFGNVLIESLASGTPVVAFDCNSGPSEIIIDKENGLLVENQNQEKLIEAMNEMVLNEKLYYHCKSNAKASIQKFSVENIGLQWLELMKIK